MSETTTTTTIAMPIIRNASSLRLKLITLQPGETIEAKREELPSSYKGMGSFISNIRKHYEVHFGVLQLPDGKGWQVKRVSTAEEAESFTPKRKKTRGGKQTEIVRLFNFTDAELLELLFKKIAIGKRDVAELSLRGVSLADLNALEADTFAFGAVPPDEHMMGHQQSAGELKTAARGVLVDRLGNLRTMAENTFGIAAVEYEVFGFEGMSGEEDEKLLRMGKRARRQGTINQAAMAPWGCTPAFLDQLLIDIQTFDNEIDNFQEAEAERKKATVLRVKTGNSLYLRLDQVCNTGKDVFRTTSYAKWNDYLIYK